MRTLLLLTLAVPLMCHAQSFVKIDDVDRRIEISKLLTKQQVREAILQGIESTGWRFDEVGTSDILAIIEVRRYTVLVEIDYSETQYGVRYQSSKNLKILCGEYDAGIRPPVKISGDEDCPDNRRPIYIHGNYKIWLGTLNAGIQRAFKNFGDPRERNSRIVEENRRRLEAQCAAQPERC